VGGSQVGVGQRSTRELDAVKFEATITRLSLPGGCLFQIRLHRARHSECTNVSPPYPTFSARVRKQCSTQELTRPNDSPPRQETCIGDDYANHQATYNANERECSNA
jgi:hypothetical protein